MNGKYRYVLNDRVQTPDMGLATITTRHSLDFVGEPTYTVTADDGTDKLHYKESELTPARPPYTTAMYEQDKRAREKRA